MNVLYLYLLLVNGLTFILFGLDKWKARHNAWRIPERTLLLLCAVGGTLGGLLGMYLFHHKTRKWKFSVLVPVLVVVWIAILVYARSL